MDDYTLLDCGARFAGDVEPQHRAATGGHFGECTEVLRHGPSERIAETLSDSTGLFDDEGDGVDRHLVSPLTRSGSVGGGLKTVEVGVGALGSKQLLMGADFGNGVTGQDDDQVSHPDRGEAV